MFPTISLITLGDFVSTLTSAAFLSVVSGGGVLFISSHVLLIYMEIIENVLTDLSLKLFPWSLTLNVIGGCLKSPLLALSFSRGGRCHFFLSIAEKADEKFELKCRAKEDEELSDNHSYVHCCHTHCCRYLYFKIKNQTVPFKIFHVSVVKYLT